jgi:hypothetical protein
MHRWHAKANNGHPEPPSTASARNPAHKSDYLPQSLLDTGNQDSHSSDVSSTFRSIQCPDIHIRNDSGLHDILLQMP